MKFIAIILISCCLAVGACNEQPPTGTSGEGDLIVEQLSETELIEKATAYRDQWVAEQASKDDAPHLAEGEVDLIEATDTGWYVRFMTYTSAGPEGTHVYYLHVYVTENGSLDRVVRGPDMLS